MAGEITIQDMDDEELARAQFRAADGTFRGRPPKTVPRTFAQQISLELSRRTDSRIRERFLDIVDEVQRIALSGMYESDRLRAANMLWERTFGKVPDKVEMAVQEKPWEGMLSKVVGGDENVVPITKPRTGRRTRPKEES
jgi:hypothetical protein